MTLYTVRTTDYYGGKHNINLYEVDADSMEISANSTGGAAVLAAKKDGSYIAFFQDWDACYRDDLVEITATSPVFTINGVPVSDEALTEDRPGIPRPDHRG